MTLMIRCTRQPTSVDPFNRRSSSPYPPTPPKILRDRTWRCSVTFVADGERDTFTSLQTAQTVDEAMLGNIAAAEREYGGDWDEITDHTATEVR